MLDDEVLCLVGKLDFKATFSQSLANLCQFVIDHLLEVVIVQVPKDDHIIESVKKLRAEHSLDGIHHPGLHAIVRSIIGGFLESEGLLVLNGLCSSIGRQDQDRVSEVDIATEAIGKPTFFHHLQEHVEHIGVRFFDFIEKNHRIGTSTDFLSQLSTFLVSDISRRSPDQSAHVVLLHVFAHVDVYECIGISEEALGEGFGKQCLTDTGWPCKYKATGRSLRILQATATASDGTSNRSNGLFLTDNTFVQLTFHVH